MIDRIGVFTVSENDQHAQWRRLGKRLWAGRRGISSLGTIEWGRRFVWIDPDGRARGRYSSLLDAQDAAESGTRT